MGNLGRIALPPASRLSTDLDDPALVDAARGGDSAALDMLLRRHYDRVFAVCRRITGSHADAADAAQEALIAIVRGLPRFDGRSAFSTWAYRVAANASLDELRRRKRRPVPAASDTDRTVAEAIDPSADRSIDDIAARLTDGPALDAALGRLSDDFRIPVVLRDVADLDYAEIASALGIPIGTVKSRIARGRAQLARDLGLAPGNHDLDSRRPTEAS
ncbi:MAG: RNA polymerase sigma factor [Ilumatobacteraceae bacterium]